MTIIDESRAHAELRDRLDHLRRVAAARQRVHAFIEAYGRVLEWKPVFRADGAVLRIDGTKVALQVDDLRILLDSEFAPSRDVKQDDDDEDETGLHRRQAAAQLGREEENPEFPDESPDDRDYPSPRGWDRV